MEFFSSMLVGFLTLFASETLPSEPESTTREVTFVSSPVIQSIKAEPAKEIIHASYYGYGDGFHGRQTANGERFDAHGLTAAHKTKPFGTRARVTYQGRSVIVRINDRGPYIPGRGIDLSYGAAREIGLVECGHAPVTVEWLS